LKAEAARMSNEKPERSKKECSGFFVVIYGLLPLAE
jgi:hypothetical protein